MNLKTGKALSCFIILTSGPVISVYRLIREILHTAGNLVKQELKENTSATLVKIGRLDCAYSKEMFEEEGTYYTSHLWIAGIDDVAFECSFTVRKGEPVAEAESIIASLEVRRAGQKYPAEIIPVRLSEIYRINEAYEWVCTTVKEQLKKDFQDRKKI